jgi:exopolysaccharide biosynthesis polyprenyl glycosylphosphotransferase
MIPRRFFWLLDALALWLAFISAYALVPVFHAWMNPGNFLYLPDLFARLSPVDWEGKMPSLRDYLWIYMTMLAAALLVLLSFRDYGRLLYQSRTRIIGASVLAALSGISLVTLLSYSLKSSVGGRLFLFTFMVLSALGLSAYRLLFRQFFRQRQRSGTYARNVLLLGQRSGLDWMIRHFESSIPASEYRLLGQLCPPGETAPGGSVPLLGEISGLGDLLVNHPIHEVIAIQPLNNGAWIEAVIQACDYMGVLLRIVPEVLLREPHTLKTLYPFAALNLPAVVLTPPRWDSDALLAKRVFDLLVSGILLVLLSPLFLVVAVAIKLTTPRLPVFYRWRVVGQNGVEFTGYKFTSMVADADLRKAQLQAKNEMSGPVFKIKNDPRVTPLGRFLRKFSLNELPQLWSVFKGDMSLVGPRPAFRYELDRYEFWQKRKLTIKPGITCLWQIRGRNKISNFDDWVRMDLEYIDQWSLWLDFRILVRTAWVVITGTGS